METYIDPSTGELEPTTPPETVEDKLAYLLAWARHEQCAEPERKASSLPMQGNTGSPRIMLDPIVFRNH